MTNATTVVASQHAAKRPSLVANNLIFALTAGLLGGGAVVLIMSVGGVGPHLTPLELFAVAGGGARQHGARCRVFVSSRRPESEALDNGGRPCPVDLCRQLDRPRCARTCQRLLCIGGVGSGSPSLGGWRHRDSLRTHSIGWPDWQLFRVTVHLGLRAWGGTLSRFLNFRLDQLVLGLLATQSTLAIYATAVNASEVSLYVPVAVAAAAIPTIARISPAHRSVQVLATFRPLLVVTTVVVAAALIGVPAIPLVFGGRYQDAVLPYLILLPGALGYVAIGVFSSALLNSDRPVLSSLPSAVSLGTGLVFDLVLIPPFQAAGAGLLRASRFSRAAYRP